MMGDRSDDFKLETIQPPEVKHVLRCMQNVETSNHETTQVSRAHERLQINVNIPENLEYPMFFHFGVAETILFADWRTTDWQGILGSMIGIILLAAAFEGLKNYREELFVNTVAESKCEGKKKTRRQMILSSVHLFQTILHMIQFVIGYFLMFIFMTYNVWLALAVVIGTGLGYWLFAWNKFTSEDADCCS